MVSESNEYVLHLCMDLFSAFERTLPQLHEMVELAGLKVKKVNATRLVTDSIIPPCTVANIYQGLGFNH